MSCRGKNQVSFGYSVQNVVDVEKETCIFPPNLLKNTLEEVGNFVALSILLISLFTAEDVKTIIEKKECNDISWGGRKECNTHPGV
jgi:hypothetical protein